MITYKLYTNIGSRDTNEDSVGELEKDGSYCFVLADGLGGHGRGEVASSIAVETALKLFDENGNSSEYPAECFRKVQETVMERQSSSPELADMKTTMVLLRIDREEIIWGHIGDSRLYHFQSGKLKSHTLDHSVPQMLVSAGEIKEKDIRFHEDRNRLLRVIGAEWGNRSFDLSELIGRRSGQAFLMCSDGFWELIDEKQMIKCLRAANTVEEWMDSMVEIVNAEGAGKDMDNNSAIAVWVTKE